MKSITTITQKGQITLPVEMRRKLGMNVFSKVCLQITDTYIKVLPTDDILSFAGKVKSSKNKSVLAARKEMEKRYELR